jgi:hypothetical protein
VSSAAIVIAIAVANQDSTSLGCYLNSATAAAPTSPCFCAHAALPQKHHNSKLILTPGLYNPHSLVLSMARFRLRSHNLKECFAGIKEFGLCVAASDVQLWKCAIFLWMMKPN